jgi:hypothetical protein
MAGTTRLELATSDVTGSPKAHSTSIYDQLAPPKAVFIRQKPSKKPSGFTEKIASPSRSSGIEDGVRVYWSRTLSYTAVFRVSFVV